MARDYTKYNVQGIEENLNKRKLVSTIVKDWIEKNNPSLEELQNAFPDELQGSSGLIKKESEVKFPKKFNMKEPLSIKNGMHVVVCNQWGENILDFIAASEKLGYKISKSETSKSEKMASSNLTAEQIEEFKEQEAEIKGDYKENSWEASSLYDDLIEAGDTAWADQILQKIAAAAESFSDINQVCEKLKERNETDRFLATVKKAEAMAERLWQFVSLAELVSDTDKDLAIELYKKAEDKAEDLHDILRIADAVFLVDKDWAIKLLEKAEEKAKEFHEFLSIGDVYGKADGLADKDKAITFFEKAISFIEDEWDTEKLLESAQECLGNEDAFTKKIALMVSPIQDDSNE